MTSISCTFCLYVTQRFIFQVLVPPGFGQDVREQQNRKQPLLSTPSAVIPVSTLTSPLPPPVGLSHVETHMNVSRPSSASDFDRSNIIRKIDESYRHENGWDNSHAYGDRANHLASDSTVLQRCPSPITSSNRIRYNSESNVYPGPGGQHNTLVGQHVLSVNMFSKDHLNELFNLAQTMRAFVLKERNLDHILKVSSS